MSPFSGMQVINAAYTLVREPRSIVALKSMSVFKETWAENVSSLTDAVDAITSLDEFMSVTGMQSIKVYLCKRS